MALAVQSQSEAVRSVPNLRYVSHWSVRAGTVEDYESWRAVYHEVASEGQWIGGEQAPPDEVMRPRFQAAIDGPDHLMLMVADDQNDVVGGLMADFVRPGVISLGMLLLEKWRGRGAGSALMTECIAWCRDRGAHKVTLGVWPHNDRAIALYTRFGFSPEGRLVRHYRRASGELWDSIEMGLLLDTTSPGSPHPDADNLPGRGTGRGTSPGDVASAQ